MEPTQRQQLIVDARICPYCGREPEFVDSSEVYGRSYGMIYLCRPCNAYVGVHKNSRKSKGRLANGKLRKLKMEAHKYFDQIWKLEYMTRREAYKWLSEKLDLPREYTHIGMFTERICLDVVYYSKQFLNDMRFLDLDIGAEPKTRYFEL